jgi:hypothetical protein
VEQVDFGTEYQAVKKVRESENDDNKQTLSHN